MLENPTPCGTSSSYHIISPYAGTTNAMYEICQHVGKSYATCDLSIIRRNYQRHAHYNPPREVKLPWKTHGQSRVKLPKLGQTGSSGPRPPNSDPKVLIGSTRPKTHVLQVWIAKDAQ
ncbi:hypothetical protein L3X38_041574 [Prunus dulcis]|uniref:Uncharacterized protein n=1 Tax=Prunus dulcis TaxID=3755 RepID=A0AAD4UUL8_PRUDU|nr:hypothetical protein L3X38_041574 [Prunus dulcis]